MLLACPELAGRPASELLPIFDEWYRAIQQFTKSDRITCLGKFVEAWEWASVPYGEAFTRIVERARSSSGPDDAEKLGITDERVKLLMRLCRELQRHWGDRPFYLSARTAGGIIGVSHTTANTWFNALRGLGVLQCVHRGEVKAGKAIASEWRYLLPLDDDAAWRPIVSPTASVPLPQNAKSV